MCCRISGTVNYPPSVCISMTEKQTKGGPDSSKVSVYDNVTLGHNLLSIIGHQAQPISNERYTLTFNGCWYDYKSYYPYDTSDTVSLLSHFTRRGLDALEDVNGMFAIGLYDKIEQKLHLICDRFAQKPIYYYHSGDKFAFASNPAALYDLQDEWEIDREALQSYWLLGSVMGEDSVLKGVKKVCASEIVTFDIKSGTLERKRWYEPKFQDNAISVIEDVVIDAIDKVKVADVPIHIFLSGGIDSTLVASRFANGKAIHLASPEEVYAQQVADKFNIDLKVLKSFDIETDTCLKDYCLNSGEPTMAGLIPYITAREVSKFGRVAITANGADELFFGYNRTKENATQEQINHIFRNSMDSYGLTIDRYEDKRFGDGRLLELRSYVQFDLNKTLDSASMCHGLEVRSPFLDHRIVEAALSIPESIHRKRGNKTILKDILRRLGFNDQFLDRPKIGFSLYQKPRDIDKIIQKAWIWCKATGYLKCDDHKLTGRDKVYLEMSAVGFYYWYETWKHKIK